MSNVTESFEERRARETAEANHRLWKEEASRLFQTIDGIIVSKLHHLHERPQSLIIERDETNGNLHINVGLEKHNVDITIRVRPENEI